jgi:hypothetical protein
MKRRLLITVFTVIAMTCLATSPGAPAQEVAKVPDGSVAIHYWRPNGDYEQWGLHLWESFDKVKDGKVVGPKEKSDAPLSGVSWGTPMMPTGKDGFGIYWIAKASEFRNGKVNYIIHKGDSKEQCGKDIALFIETQGREAFVNSGDCNTYFKAEDAISARKK